MKKLHKLILKAVELGYTVEDGVIYFNEEEVKLFPDSKNRLRFFIENNKPTFIPVHKFVAYKKYGDRAFENGIMIRHLDNNHLNNADDNIALGTAYDNAMDIPAEQRRINAGNQSRKYDHGEILEFYNITRSYKQTMEKFGISSKGTLNYILKRSLAKLA